ncbi:hypothetical protein C1I93_12655 [Micromonospora endophytica]|uniref:Uncharacterized protein n=1 Tax=Micromonospora endophytica TaxID=515350 RepID=A0A2W2CH18_9ACTN|nr:hypothetical protein C1I93_12655 [Micromonospora endophytica]
MFPAATSSPPSWRPCFGTTAREATRNGRHPSSEERILTGQESTEPGAVPSGPTVQPPSHA